MPGSSTSSEMRSRVPTRAHCGHQRARRPMRYQVPLVRREADLERTNADGGLVPTNRHSHAASYVANLPSSSVWPAEAEVTSQPDSGHRLTRGGLTVELNP